MRGVNTAGGQNKRVGFKEKKVSWAKLKRDVDEWHRLFMQSRGLTHNGPKIGRPRKKDGGADL